MNALKMLIYISCLGERFFVVSDLVAFNSEISFTKLQCVGIQDGLIPCVTRLLLCLFHLKNDNSTVFGNNIPLTSSFLFGLKWNLNITAKAQQQMHHQVVLQLTRLQCLLDRILTCVSTLRLDKVSVFAFVFFLLF